MDDSLYTFLQNVGRCDVRVFISYYENQQYLEKLVIKSSYSLVLIFLLFFVVGVFVFVLLLFIIVLYMNENHRWESRGGGRKQIAMSGTQIRDDL